MIRVAAVGDIHLGEDSAGRIRSAYEDLADHVDVLLIAGDLARLSTRGEAEVVAKELGHLAVPTFAVLGNHDYQSDLQDEITGVLADADINVLEGSGAVIEVGGETLGIAGTKGFGGGFVGACASEFGEPEMMAFVQRTQRVAAALSSAIEKLEADHLVSLTHYAPCDMTLAGEPAAIHPFLGSYLIGEVVDGELGGKPVDLAIHGHAHRGIERGVTPGGVRVRNVAQPAIERPYHVYCLGEDAPADLHCAVSDLRHVPGVE